MLEVELVTRWSVLVYVCARYKELLAVSCYRVTNFQQIFYTHYNNSVLVE